MVDPQFVLHDQINQMEVLMVGNWMTPSPYRAHIGQTLREAAQLMNQLHIKCLPIVDEDDRPIGMLTLKKLLNSFINGDPDVRINLVQHRSFKTVGPKDNLLDIYPLPYEQYPVIDEQGKLIGILTRRDILDGFSKYIYCLRQMEHNAETLNVILESAYEGIAVVDKHGILLEFNKAYSRFTGIKREEAIGRHVKEVIENTNLHITVKTGIPERGVLQTIQGQAMVVHRIPIWKENKIVGAIGMLIFEGVSEAYEIFERLIAVSQNDEAKNNPIALKERSDIQVNFDQIIGNSEEIANIKRMARKAARTSATVLITGESGTGKEMFAKGIHHLSPFSNGPFISVNCGAIPEHLFESELFGYEEGAFTGAKKGGKPGKFELAENGTLFLDEIGEMPLVMQTKLLRVLQEREVERVGGITKYRINVRLIAATNRDLEEMIENGEFREDLFYRLNIIRLHVPALRDRKEDIPLLLAHCVKKICHSYQVPEKRFTKEAVSAFVYYQWRGNIREMINTIERLVTLIDGDIIDLEQLPEYIRDSIKMDEKHSLLTPKSLIERTKE